jgi:hypothetical protein
MSEAKKKQKKRIRRHREPLMVISREGGDSTIEVVPTPDFTEMSDLLKWVRGPTCELDDDTNYSVIRYCGDLKTVTKTTRTVELTHDEPEPEEPQVTT